jgi:transcriptional regulator with XRE-family HTH domain
MGSSAQDGLGTRLRAARQRRGWNREALAFHSGISWSAIAQVESGRRTNVRPSTLHALALALGVTIDYLVVGRSVAAPMMEHQALLYATDAEFVDAAGPFLADALARSEPALAVTTKHNIGLLREQLGPRAAGVQFFDSSRWYTTPVRALKRYLAFLEIELESAAPWVWIIGEPVHTHRGEANGRSWTQYEALLNVALGAEPVTVLCPYDARTVDQQVLRDARATHPHLVEGCSVAPSRQYAEQWGRLL